MENQNIIGKNIKRLRVEIGLSQEELGSGVGVTKSTISQWELGKAYPKPRNIVKLAEELNVPKESIEECQYLEKNYRNSQYEQNIKPIPFYSETRALTEHSHLNKEENFELVPVKYLPNATSSNDLFCIFASGDSMEPAFNHGSLLVIDVSQKNIVDGKMYAFGKEATKRVKVFSYEKNGIKLSSLKAGYSDEFYRFDELSSLKILGKVVLYFTKID